MKIEIILDSVPLVSGEADEAVMEEFLAEQRVFAALISAGLSRDQANRLMIERIKNKNTV